MSIAAIFTTYSVEGEIVETPYGPAGPIWMETLGGRAAIFAARGGDPRARVVAVKERGAVHAVGLGASIVLTPDELALTTRLRLGEWFAPADVIDQTRGAPTTFFTAIGLGYLPQSPPFCAETRAALTAAVGDQDLVVVAAPERAITPAEVRAWGILGGAIAMPGLAPEWYLCRELEIGYAPLCCVSWASGESRPLTDSAARPMIETVVAALPEAQSWMGSNTAARRKRGDDWREWVAA